MYAEYLHVLWHLQIAYAQPMFLLRDGHLQDACARVVTEQHGCRLRRMHELIEHISDRSGEMLHNVDRICWSQDCILALPRWIDASNDAARNVEVTQHQLARLEIEKIVLHHTDKYGWLGVKQDTTDRCLIEAFSRLHVAHLPRKVGHMALTCAGVHLPFEELERYDGRSPLGAQHAGVTHPVHLHFAGDAQCRA
eukprot:scaffold159642_cov33-Tisochrysis_lutea.AAC.4